MRAVVVAILFLCASCEDAPTPEYAKAKAAYQSAFADTADVTYKGARWDEVLALLKAVPSSNAKEQRLAQQLVHDIESTRARIAADLRASDEKAAKLLDIQSLPPLDTTPRPKDPPAAPKRNPQACADDCKKKFLSCMADAGCAPTASAPTDTGGRMKFDCGLDAKEKALACNDGYGTCGSTCN